MRNRLSIVYMLLAGLVLALPAMAAEHEASITPNAGYIEVDGDEPAFREHFWTRDGTRGGVEHFSLRSGLEWGGSLWAEGHAGLNNDDYRFLLELRKDDAGMLRAGYSQFTKYFDDSGGFYEPFPVTYFELDQDLELDIGHAFIEIGIFPPDWPEIGLSYERRFKNGEKSLTGWGAVTQGGVTRNIFPAYLEINETLDIFAARIDHEMDKVRLHDRLQYEHYENRTTRREAERDMDAGRAETVTVDESRNSNSLFNTFHAEVNFNDGMYASAGYFYSMHEGGADFDMTTTPFNQAFDKNWSATGVDLDREAHVVNLNLMAGPYYETKVSGGIEGAVSKTEGETEATLTEIAFGGAVNAPEADISTDNDRKGLRENLSISYSGLPGTDIYGRGEWSQTEIQLDEREFEDGVPGFERSTDTDRDGTSYKIGFNTRPVRRVALSGHYKWEKTANNYDHDEDTLPNGYSAFINEQDITTNEFGARLSAQPANRVRTSLSYRLVDREIDTTFDNDPSSVRSGNYDAGVYSLDVAYTPLTELFLSAALSYQDIRGEAHDNGVDAVIPYKGDVLSASVAARYALDENNVFRLNYSYSRSDNFEDNSRDGLPLLLDDQLQHVEAGYSRKVNENLEAELTYGFYEYEGDHNNGINDYTAHLVGLRVSLRL